MIESIDKDIIVTLDKKLNEYLYESSYNSVPLLFKVVNVVIYYDLYLLDPSVETNSVFIKSSIPYLFKEGFSLYVSTGDIRWVVGSSMAQYLTAVSKIKRENINASNLQTDL